MDFFSSFFLSFVSVTCVFIRWFIAGRLRVVHHGGRVLRFFQFQNGLCFRIC